MLTAESADHLPLPDFAKGRVVVVGDVMLDRYWSGTTSRISPEAPVPVVRVESEECRIGGAGNVAVNAASLGSATRLIGLAGDDPAADTIGAILHDRGVEAVIERVAGCRTISKLRILSRHQQLIRADFEDHFPQWDGSSLQRLVSDSLAGSDLLILSDYNKGALRAPSTLIDTTRQAGLPVVVDPKGSDYSRYRGATIVTPNLSEFEAVAGHCSSEDELVRRGYALCDQLELNALLITRSERGMTLLVRGAPPLHLPTRAREVFDVTGAGDTVVATLGAALATGEPLADAVALANIAAGLVVARLGTATVTPQELRDAATPLIPVGAHAILDQPTAVAEVAAARRRGERVVMTNGCFDLLHPGHIDYLTRARALGDRLLVAVNDDSSVQRLKGESRPVNPLESRMAMLAALAAVDWVVPFSEDTPRRLICSIGPDLLVKGGDYRPEEIAGGDCVVAAGGEVRVLDFLPGHSSSAIIQRICEVNR